MIDVESLNLQVTNNMRKIDCLYDMIQSFKNTIELHQEALESIDFVIRNIVDQLEEMKR